MFLCSGQQPAIHHLAQCWSGSLRQHHRSLNHSISTKDRYIRRKQHARDGSHCDRSSDHGESHVGSNSQNGCDGKDSKPHSQGTTSVLGHRRRCSVEHVFEDARVALLESVFVAMLPVGRQSRVPFGGSPAAAAAPPNPIPVSEGWAQLDTVDFQEELLTRVPMLKSCPHWLRGRFDSGIAGKASSQVGER